MEKSCRAEQATSGNTAHVQCMLENKVTNKNSESEIFIAFTWQKWLRERAWMFPDAHFACLVLLLVKLLTQVTYQPDVVSDSIHVFRHSICTLTYLVRYLLL